jgi:hypothetical protein
LQENAFELLVSIVRGATKLLKLTNNDNYLLSSYIQYIFKDVILTKNPICYVLAFEWTKILSSKKEIEKKVMDKKGNKNEKPIKMTDFKNNGKTVNIDENEFKKLLDFFESDSIPLYFETLIYSWFFFDIIIKSLKISNPIDNGKSLKGPFKELLVQLSGIFISF